MRLCLSQYVVIMAGNSVFLLAPLFHYLVNLSHAVIIAILVIYAVMKLHVLDFGYGILTWSVKRHFWGKISVSLAT